VPITVTTGDRVFPECRLHSGKGQLHSGKPSPSATLGEEDSVKRFTGKPASPRVKNRALGEYFPERHASTRGRLLFFLKTPQASQALWAPPSARLSAVAVAVAASAFAASAS
jgi:hypothetical protein